MTPSARPDALNTAPGKGSAISLSGRRALDACCLAMLAGLVFFVLIESLTQPERLVIAYDMDQPFNWEAYNRHALAAGQLPYWNPYVFSGFPAMADIQTGLFYPPNVVLRLLPLTLQNFFSWNLAFHLWVMATGTFALARQLGIGRIASLVAAIGMMLGGATAPRIWAGHLLLIYGFCWMPLAVAAAVHSFTRRSALPTWAFVLTLALQILSAATQPALYTVTIVAIYAVMLAFWPIERRDTWEARLHPLMQLAAGGALALGLTAFQVWPLLELLNESARGGGLDPSQAAKGSFELRHLSTVFFPTALANLQNQFQDGSPGALWEKCPYAGLLLAVVAPLAVFARDHRRTVMFFGVVALGALAFSFGEHLPVFEIHHTILPGFRIPSRLLSAWQLAIAVLGAIALDTLVRRWRPLSGPIVGLYLTGVALALLWASGPAVIAQLSQASGPAPRTFGTDSRIVAATGAGLILIPVIGLAARLPSPALALALGLTALDLGAFAGQFLTISGPSRNLEAERLFADVEVGRVLSICHSKLTSNTMMNLMVPTVDGYNSAYLRNYANLTGLVVGEELNARRTAFAKIGASSELPRRMTLVNLLNTTHIHACGNVAGPFELVRATEDMQLYRNQAALPRASWICQVDLVNNDNRAARNLRESGFDPSRLAVVVNDDPGAESLRELRRPCATDAEIQILTRDTPSGELVANVNAHDSGLLVLSEVYYPARNAWVDGGPTQTIRTNLALTGIALGPGQHRVELRYVPTRFYVGLLISVAALGVLIIATVVARRISRYASVLQETRTSAGATGLD
jgi:hypothetical protein